MGPRVLEEWNHEGYDYRLLEDLDHGERTQTVLIFRSGEWRRCADQSIRPCILGNGGKPMTATEIKERILQIEAPDAAKIMEPILDKILGLSSDAVTRKATPIFSGVLMYFPDALAAVAELSRIGNEQHNPGEPLHWARSKSGDEYDALTRHLLEVGTIDTDGVRHATKVAWRALAGLQKELEMAAGIDKSKEA